MSAVNRKSFEKLQDRFGHGLTFESGNPILSEILTEISNENRVPFNVHRDSAYDEAVNQYFSNSYAYVKFSK